jgi:hypothetical protein
MEKRKEYIIEYLHAIYWFLKNCKKVRRYKGKNMLYLSFKHFPLRTLYPSMSERIPRVVHAPPLKCSFCQKGT